MTIEELANRTCMTVRNIREWQTNGLLPGPERRGRVGIYTDDHVLRIERIRALQAQQFPLQVIRRLLDRSGAESEHDVRRLATEVFDPNNPTSTLELKREDLARRFGADGERHLSACGLVAVLDDDLVAIIDTATFDYVEKLVAIGLPLDKVALTLTRMADHHVASVQALVDLYREEVWRPFTEAGLPTEQWHAVAERTRQLRPLAVGLGIQAFKRAVDAVVGTVAGEEAIRLENQGHV